LEYWAQNTKDINRRDQYRRTLLHYACYYGNLQAVQKLLADDRIIVNAIDQDGNTCLHVTLKGKQKIFMVLNFFLENESPLSGQRGQRSQYQLIADRFECIKGLISTNEESKKPKLTLANRTWEKLTPYQ
jgi:ankyrin repeat protein